MRHLCAEDFRSVRAFASGVLTPYVRDSPSEDISAMIGLVRKSFFGFAHVSYVHGERYGNVISRNMGSPTLLGPIRFFLQEDISSANLTCSQLIRVKKVWTFKDGVEGLHAKHSQDACKHFRTL